MAENVTQKRTLETPDEGGEQTVIGPDWRTMSPDQAIEHDRTAEAPDNLEPKVSEDFEQVGETCDECSPALDEIAAISQDAGLDELTGEPPIRR